MTPRISASSYSNTAPLIWSFLYGSNHGKVELLLDNAPARSAEMLTQDRVDAALVPVIAYHQFADVKLIPGVCVAAKERVRSVCLVTRGEDLADVRSVALDVSSRTSVVLTKIIFKEFLGVEPEWHDSAPNIETMLQTADCALLIGDPALSLKDEGRGTTDDSRRADTSFILQPSSLRKFDLAELWHFNTNLGFIFAMWMTRHDSSPVDFASARDEGLTHLDAIVSNYRSEIPIGDEAFRNYLSKNISYRVDEDLLRGMELYFALAKKHGLCENIRELEYTK
jgi:chorismate dehydratase